MKPICKKGPVFQFRVFLAVVMSFFIIITDSRRETFIKIRSYMDTAISPFYFLAHSSRQLLNYISQALTTRTQLEHENWTLRQELLLKNSEQLLLGHYKEENARLRALLGSPLRKDEQKMITQVISISADPYRNQIVINKGLDHGVYVGQTVINDKGVVGQVIATNKLTSRVLLICDSSHALPIQILRNDIRLIVAGNGSTEHLQLEQLPGNVDIRVGDILVTSGLGGRFPEGYPVATVSSVKTDAKTAYTIMQARPTAKLQSLRHLLLLWDTESHGNITRPPEIIHHIANERLKRTIPQVLSLSNTVVSPVQATNSTQTKGHYAVQTSDIDCFEQ
ncbi:rod shape-determining protein MreC [Candidatus Curculioniphilus buchneri]|uniref:rod shape-determining protein MreC n=1 Tax=Candidatus Curculioniphilus buchneri TaxID=690594 RepID=UPI00376F2281